MTHRFLAGALLAAAATLGLASAASAQAVQRSGAVYHRAVCPGPAEPGSARCHAHIVTDARGNPLPAKFPFSSFSGYTATQIRDAYKVSGSSSVTVAIVDAYGYPTAAQDLAIYRQNMGLPPCDSSCLTIVGQTGGAPPTTSNLGWDQEQALDLDMVSAICPSCKILLVQSNSNNFDDITAAVDYATANAQVVSNSYGGGEAGTASYEPHYDVTGVAITASSGDNGYGVEFPAAAPHVTAVGGTSLKTASNTRGWSETAWSGAGSGCSAVYAKMVWQTDTGCANRTVADVSAVADPNTGVRVYAPGRRGSGWYIFGGTSVAAPIIAGMYALQGGGNGTGSEPYSHTGNLFDVTSGSNGACSPSYLCTAGAGYDGPTGLGTPNGTTAF
ncbi:MAG: S8 family serine peptidase [Rhodospirillaceae bacterium]